MAPSQPQRLDSPQTGRTAPTDGLGAVMVLA